MAKENKSKEQVKITVKEIPAVAPRLVEDVDASGSEKPKEPVVPAELDATKAPVDSVAAASAETDKAPAPAPEPVGTVPAAPEVVASVAAVDAGVAKAPEATVPTTDPVPALPAKADDSDVAKSTAVAESLDGLMSSEKALTEDFKSKASLLFEETVKTKVAAELTRLEENYQVQLNEEATKLTSGLAEKVDAYLSYAIKNWLTENQVSVDAGLRTEIAENFISSMKTLFTESYITVPEGKEDMVSTLTKKVSTLEEQLNAATANAITLNESVNRYARAQIIAEASSNLASTQTVKLNQLLEGVAFENETSFKGKVQSLKELHFSNKKPVLSEKGSARTIVSIDSHEPAMSLAEAKESLSSEGDKQLTGSMEVYSNSISRLQKTK